MNVRLYLKGFEPQKPFHQLLSLPRRVRNTDKTISLRSAGRNQVQTKKTQITKGEKKVKVFKIEATSLRLVQI